MDLLKKILETKKVAQDKDIKDREGTQPKKYFSGVSKKSKEARDRHFKKGAKMDDDNPAAYKPAPGDAGAKTKPSKHTKKFQQMFGENYDGDMAQNALENIVRNANNLKRVVKEDGDYPAWWNSKLTKADDYLDVCHDYLMSELSQSEQIDEELEEGRLVAPAQQIIKTVANEIQKKMQDMYSKRPGDGVSLINQFARMAGMTVSDKKQQKGTLFLKMGDELSEAVDVKKALSKVKGLTKKQLEVLAGLPQSQLVVIAQQLSGLVMGEETIEEKRLADILRDKEKSKQNAHQQRMMKLAKQSIKKNKKEELGKNADAGDYVDDFRKSDAPQFKGKSDEKIRDMAIAAYLSKNESTKEYGKSLRKIALDRQLKSISKKDKDTLLKIAALLAKEK